MDVKTPSCAYKNPVNKSCYLNVNSKLFGRNAMDVDTMLCAYKNPVNTRRYFDIVSIVFERHGRQMDIRTMLCNNITTTRIKIRSKGSHPIPFGPFEHPNHRFFLTVKC